MKNKTAIMAFICALSLSTVSAYAATLAFPGAEGGGKYTTGARGSSSRSVYHVTNLNESGKGSFADAVSKSGRVIVFDVGGTIHLSNTLRIRSDNLTILGQTAPGDGITFTGGDILLSSGIKNVIMRHIRVRPTDDNGGEPDAIGGRWNKNIILDHCSMSWSVDEMLTIYGGSTESGEQGSLITVQNCIAAESLRMSNHFKGAHGYGAIVGATNSSWLNNIFAHHDSRSPRLDRELKNTDFSNNIIYDWGITNSAYGAEPYSYNNVTNTPSVVNWKNNYYKYGPGTGIKLRSRIFDVSNSGQTPYSRFYFGGNYVWGDESVTSDNIKGINNIEYAEILNEEVDMGDYTYAAMSAEEAYANVLENAGATLPRRDAVDARIVNDVKNHTGRIINNANEVGGGIETETVTRKFTIPSDWISENGLTGYKETDIISGGDFEGYMLIEAYVNDWTQKQEAPTNPMVTVLSPAIAAINDTVNGYNVNNGNWTVINDDEYVEYHAVADAVNDVNVTNMQLYDGNELIATYDGSEINDKVRLEAGTHYLSCRAYNEKGEATQSTESIVYVNSTADSGSFGFTDIGSTSFGDAGAAWLDENSGVYTISGSGDLTSVREDSCGFMYKAIDGDFDVTVKTETIPKYENGQVSGLMARASLDSDSVMGMIADGWLKYGENVRVISRKNSGSKSSEIYFKNSSGKSIENDSNYDTSNSSYTMPSYMRIVRKGNTLTFSVSNSGTNWTDNPRQPMSITYNELPNTMYVGIAVDSAQGTSVKDYFTQAEYSKLYVNGMADVEIGISSVKQETMWTFEDYLDTSFAGEVFVGKYMRVLGSAKISVDSVSKQINNITYAARLKLGGGAAFGSDGIPTAGAIEIKPAADGTVSVTYAHASSSGAARYLAVMQNGEVKASQGVDAASTACLTCDVDGGSSVYIYSQGSGINIYGVNYVPDSAETPIPDLTPTPAVITPTPTPTVEPTPIPTVIPIPDFTPEIKSSIEIKEGKAEVFSTVKGTVYVVGYENGRLVSAVGYNISEGENISMDIMPNEAVKVMLWDENGVPQCSVIQL